MIRHVVVWRLKDHADGHGKEENIARVKAALEGLPARIPGYVGQRVEVGVNLFEGVGSHANWDLALIADFEDEEALKAYFRHPAHVEVAELVGRVREERAGVDFEVP